MTIKAVTPISFCIILPFLGFAPLSCRPGVAYAGVRCDGLAARTNPESRIVLGADGNLRLPTSTEQVTEVVGFGNHALERETKSSEFNKITGFRRPHSAHDCWRNIPCTNNRPSEHSIPHKRMTLRGICKLSLFDGHKVQAHWRRHVERLAGRG